MTRVALKGLLQRKLRSVLTALAVMLGVAMVSGTFMLTDSIEKAFTSIFNSGYSDTDVVVSGRPLVEGASSGTPVVPEQVLSDVQGLPGVAAAGGSLMDLESNSNSAKLLGRDGKPISTGDSPNLGLGMDPKQPQFTPMELSEGEWPVGAGEIVIDAATADSEDFGVGDTIRVAAGGAVNDYTVTGIATFGDVESLGGATIGVFDVAVAQDLFDKDGYDTISVTARDGTTPAQLMEQIRPVLPQNVKVETSAARAAADSKEVTTFISYLRYALLAFGGIALFVGGFVIFNTLTITIAQRTRELATLRTIGASRRQVMRSVVVETAAIGTLASLGGLALGYGLSRGLSSVFGALGLSLPEATTVIQTRTIVISLVIGIGITLIAGVLPAFRATRIAPINAVREGATASSGRHSRVSLPFAVVMLSIAFLTLGYGLFADVATNVRLLMIAGGSLAGFVGVAAISPRLVRPLALVLGYPGRRLGGAAGKLATQNAIRNPSRTAATAAALMVGLTLVTTVAVLGQGLRNSSTSTVERQVTAEYVVTAEDGFSTLPLTVGEQIGKIPLVESSSVRSDKAKVDGSDVAVTGVEPNIGGFYAFRYKGTPGADPVASLSTGGAIVRKTFAEEHDITIGSQLEMLTPSGERLDLKVSAILDPGTFDLDPLLGSVVIDQAAFDGSFPRPADLYTFLNVPAEGEQFVAQAEAEAVKRYPGVKLNTKDEFVQSRVAGLSDILNLLYVLLALSVVVSLFGMINTLVLAVYERTRELGMLRAIGMPARQIRSMVRQESVTTALIGAAIGLPLGIGLAAAVTSALSEYDIQFSVPLLTLLAFVVVALVAGVLAAVMPARRAGRLNVLEALQYE
ncbi:MAG: putative transport system permease protein [Gaiellales bacterium]|jgi:putative ABC transport system permease protein|nr:putative transport system permease protein [Gaiellales bacterium]